MDIEQPLYENQEVVDIVLGARQSKDVQGPLKLAPQKIVEDYFRLWLSSSAEVGQKDWVKISPFLSTEDKGTISEIEEKLQKRLVISSYSVLLAEYALYHAFFKHHRIFYWGVSKKRSYLRSFFRFGTKYCVIPLFLLQLNTFTIYQALKHQEADSLRKAGFFKKYCSDVFFSDENY